MDARLLLVHSPLVGCGTWQPIAEDLAGDGYAVAVPDLAGTVVAGPLYHLCQAQVIADSAADQPAILVGHSGAGPLLAALLPDPAVRQRFAAECPRLPLAMFEEVHPPAPGWTDAPGGYLQLSEAYEGEAARARELGWPVRQQLSHHLALLAEPGQVARELRQLIGQL
jgi:alpha-beta hydrolase superfamily lysophospholipase